jgi:hypothetical protein
LLRRSVISSPDSSQVDLLSSQVPSRQLHNPLRVGVEDVPTVEVSNSRTRLLLTIDASTVNVNSD